MNHFHLFSISSLSEYLGCFDKSEYIYLGERYGYDLFSDDNGFNYITGGGGIVFNLKTIRKLVNSCTCPSPSSPDDMIISSCLKSLNIEAIHSSLFHQARNKDYSVEVLEKNSISFHKFWQIDPIATYEKWFRKRDEEYYKINKHLLSDYKYLNRDCVAPTSATTCSSTLTPVTTSSIYPSYSPTTAYNLINNYQDVMKSQNENSKANLNSKEEIRNNVKHVEL